MEFQPLGIYIPDTVNTTLQSCVNAAAKSPRGVVWIPASYAGTDTYTNPNNVPVFDMRGTGTLTVGSEIIAPGPVTLVSAATAARTATLPDNSGIIAELNFAQNFSALQEFSAGISADGTHTLTLPSATDTLVAKTTTDTLSHKTFSDTIPALRVKVNQGTVYSGADAAIVLSGGWGSTGAVSAAAGYDEAFSFTVTPGGTSIASNPTITITFKDGTFTNAPQYLVYRNDLNSPYGLPPHTITVTATTLTITFNGLPNNAGLAYKFICLALGN